MIPTLADLPQLAAALIVPAGAAYLYRHALTLILTRTDPARARGRRAPRARGAIHRARGRIAAHMPRTEDYALPPTWTEEAHR